MSRDRSGAERPAVELAVQQVLAKRIEADIDLRCGDFPACGVERTPVRGTRRDLEARQRPPQPLTDPMLALDRLGQVRGRGRLAAGVIRLRAVRRRMSVLVSVR